MKKNRTIHIEKYYTAMDHFEQKFDVISRQMRLKAANLQDFQIWKSQVRSELKKITGIFTMEGCEFNPVITERIQMNGYVRERILLETEPGVIMTLYALIPDGIKEGEKRAAIVAPHGHDSAGKFATAGRSDIPAVAEKIRRYNYDYGVKFVKEGFIVFCPDARGFGERRESTLKGDGEDQFTGSSCAQLNHMAIPLGQTVTGMWTWDLMRLLDYIESRKDCDANRIGCAGLSGGGMQTLWLTALDDRVKCSIISGYFYGYKESLLRQSGNCSCNYVPYLWQKVDMGDIGALIAPRPLLIETGSVDDLNGQSGLDNVIYQIEITKLAYKLFNKQDLIYHHVFNGPHMWDGSKSSAWMKKWLMEE